MRSQAVMEVTGLLLASTLSFACGGKDDTSVDEPKFIYYTTDGREVDLNDLEDGEYRFEIIEGKDVPPRAHELHQEARAAGSKREYEKAISLLEQAAQIAPEWPYPVYDLAYTYLLMKDSEKARLGYFKTLELAPRGFFTAITAAYTLEREHNGELPQGTYLAYISLEWLSDPEKRLSLVRQMTEKVPDFAPAWKELALLSPNDEERRQALERGLAANPDDETRGLLLFNRALSQENEDEIIRALEQLAFDPQSTFATEQLAKEQLSLIARGGRSNQR